MISAFCLFALSFLVSGEKKEYGLIFDAGSSHTQLFIFKWAPRVTSDPSNPPKTLPEAFAEEASFPYTKPGISSCHSKEEVQAYLKPHIKWARHQLESHKDRWGNFPIYLGATAGLRVLERAHRINLLKWVRDFLDDKALNPFKFSRNQATILSGEEEAVFGWLTVNYASGKLMSNSKRTLGALDLGGQSTQITWEPKPSSDILEEMTEVDLFGVNRRLYAHSFLHFGGDGAEERMRELTLQAGLMEKNPCYNAGWKGEFETHHMDSAGADIKVKYNIVGAATASSCSKITDLLMIKDTECLVGSCSINGVYQPPLNSGVTYYAFSGFYYIFNDLRRGNPALFRKPTTLKKLKAARDNICSLPWEKLKASDYSDISEKYLPNRCFMASYAISLLQTGYGFKNDDDNLIFAKKIENNGRSFSVGWTLGAILHYSNLLPFKFIAKKPPTQLEMEEAQAIEMMEQEQTAAETPVANMYQFAAVAGSVLFVVALIFRRNKEVDTEEDYSNLATTLAQDLETA